MKVICVDNMNRETRSDHLVCENVSEYYGKLITRLLQEWAGDNEDWFQLVPDDHKLYEYEP